MFPWHSTIVEPAGKLGQHGTSSCASTVSKPSSDPERSSVEQRCIQDAYERCQSVGERAPRDTSGKLTNPSAFLRAVEAAGIRFGPEGAGTLLAIADMRRPTMDEVRSHTR